MGKYILMEVTKEEELHILKRRNSKLPKTRVKKEKKSKLGESLGKETGQPCPKCEVLMERVERKNFELRPGQQYCYSAWDRCRPCGHIQHYERFKVYNYDVQATKNIQRQ